FSRLLARFSSCHFFFNDAASSDISTLSLHDALPIYVLGPLLPCSFGLPGEAQSIPWFTRRCERLFDSGTLLPALRHMPVRRASRSEEHTSELQSRENLVCRLLLEKKKQYKTHIT